jgi:phosphoribosylformylglycinamidine cyclo-ligase
MGHRMEVYVEEKYASQIISIAESFGVLAKIVGRVEASDKKQVTVKSEYGEFVYN